MVQQLPWLSAIVAVLFATFVIDNQLVATLKTRAEVTQSRLQNLLNDIATDYKSTTYIQPIRRQGYEFFSKRSTLPSSLSSASSSPTFKIAEKETEVSTPNEPELVENSSHIKETKPKVKRKINILGNRSIKGLFNVLFRKENDENLGKRVGHRSHNTRSFKTDFFGSEFLGKRSPQNAYFEHDKDEIPEFLNKNEVDRDIIGKRAPGREVLLEADAGPEFSSKRALEAKFLGRSLGGEFLGKRALGAELLGNRGSKEELLSPLEQESLKKRALGAEFLGKRAFGAEILEERMLRPEFLRKSAIGADVLGKRTRGELLEALEQEFVRNRALGSEVLRKRSLEEELLSALEQESLRKRALGSEFLGKRGFGEELLEYKAPGPEFFRNRALIPEIFKNRALGKELFDKKALKEELLETRAFGPEISVKRALGSEFLGKRGVKAEYLEKGPSGIEFIGKRILGRGISEKRNTIPEIFNQHDVYPRK